MPRHGQIRVFSLFPPIIMAPGGKKVNKMHSKHGAAQMWTRWCDAELVLHWCGVITQSMACNYLTRIKNWPLEQITRQRGEELSSSRGWWPVTRSQMASSGPHLSWPDSAPVTMILSDFRLRQGSVSSDQTKTSRHCLDSWYWKPFTPSVNSHWISSRQWDLSRDNIQDTNIQRYLLAGM